MLAFQFQYNWSFFAVKHRQIFCQRLEQMLTARRRVLPGLVVVLPTGPQGFRAGLQARRLTRGEWGQRKKKIAVRAGAPGLQLVGSVHSFAEGAAAFSPQ
jgi:hypothetical protein